MRNHHYITSFLVVALVMLSIGMIATSAEANIEDERILLDDQGTLKIINSSVSSSNVAAGNSISIRFTIENTGPDTFSDTLSFSDTGDMFEPEIEEKEYTIEPGTQKTYEISFDAEDDSNTPTDTVIQINDEDFATVTVERGGTGISGGSISTTGERQQVTKAFQQFNDQRTGVIFDPNATDTIPPVQSREGSLVNTASGRVFNFGGMTQPDNRTTTIRSDDVGTLGSTNPQPSVVNVGLTMSNVPTSEYHTLQFNYDMPDSGFDDAEVKVVTNQGEEIDADTSYHLSTPDDGQETRYFQLSKKENDYVNRTSDINLVVYAEGVGSITDRLQISYGQVLSSSEPLGIASSDIQREGIVISDYESWQNFDQDSDLSNLPSVNNFGQRDIAVVAGQLTNEGDAETTRRINLLENGTVIDAKDVHLNPDETEIVRFAFRNDDQEQNTYELSGFGGSEDANFEGGEEEELQPPIYSLESPNYVNGDLVVDPTVGETLELDASGSFAPSGEIADISWDFGWGGTASGPVVSDSITEQGTYDVTLTVEDNNGQTTSVTEVVYAGTLPPDAEAGQDLVTTVGSPVFFDGSNSSHTDANRTIESYEWDTGEGQTVSGEEANYTYSSAGTYDVELTVTDDLGNTATDIKTVTVEGPEVTAFLEASPSDNVVDEPITFDASDSFSEDPGSIVEYEWDFDNGDTETTTSPTIVYEDYDEGVYDAEVTVRNEFDETAVSTTRVEVIGDPFDVVVDGPESGTTDETLTYNVTENTSNIDRIDEWEWEMGDGTVYEDVETVNHTFSIDEDPQQVMVTVTGTSEEFNFSDSDQIQVTLDAVDPIAEIDVRSTSLNYSNFQEFDATGSSDPNGTELSYEIVPSVENNSDVLTQPTVDEYIYDEPGINTAELTVTNEFGRTDTDTVEVDVTNRGVVADPREGGEQIFEGEEFGIWISDSLSFSSNSFHVEEPYITAQSQWDFGDGTVENTESITYQWDDLGTFNAQYTASDSFGEEDTVNFTVDVDARDPNAEFDFSPNEPGSLEPVNFTSTSSHNEPRGEIVDYSWDFGDGNTSSETNPEHTYESGGTYTVSLEVTDQWGQTDQQSQFITVEQERIRIPGTTEEDYIVLYDMNDGSGSTLENQAADYPDGTLVGDDYTWQTDTPSLEGSETSIATTGSTRVDTGVEELHDDLTIDMWFRYQGGSSLHYQWNDQAGGSSGFRMFTNGIAGSGLYVRSIPGQGDISWSGNIQTGNWEHIAVVLDDSAGESRLYINGNLQETGEYSGPVDLNGLRVLGDGGIFGRGTTGGYDHYRFTTEAIDQDRVEQMASEDPDA